MYIWTDSEEKDVLKIFENIPYTCLCTDHYDSCQDSTVSDYFREYYEENLGGGLKLQRRRAKSKL